MNLFAMLAEKRTNSLIEQIKSGPLDLFLESILGVMSWIFYLDRDFKRNIKDFDGRYAFKSRDGIISASAIFSKEKMKVKKYAIDDADVTVIFKDSQALKDFLFSKDPDIIGSILNNSIMTVGNLNYLLKFGYMAKHLQLKFSL